MTTIKRAAGPVAALASILGVVAYISGFTESDGGTQSRAAQDETVPQNDQPLVPAEPRVGNSWVDHSIHIDGEAQRKILGELHESAASLYRMVQARRLVGGASSSAEFGARLSYFAATARLAWANDDFEKSYLATDSAVFAAKDHTQVVRMQVESGVGRMDDLINSQQRRAEVQLVLLRNQSEAKRRGLNVEPGT